MTRTVMIKSLGIAAAFLAATASAQTPANTGPIIALQPGAATAPPGVPEIRERQDKTGDIVFRNVNAPTLELFLPAPGRANGTAVIVAPGGGFVEVEYDAEGTSVARMLAQRGVTAFVLKYRTIRSDADPMSMPEVHMNEMAAISARAKSGIPAEVPTFAGEKHAVEDGARALAIVRRRASEWGIDPHRVGMVGFSAGAFLAADLAIGDTASRPDFVGLIYGGLRTPVRVDASPAFIAAASDDPYTPNDPVLLYSAWRKAGVAAELHTYEQGGHGFGMSSKGATSDHWFDEFMWWLQSRGLAGPGAKHSD